MDSDFLAKTLGRQWQTEGDVEIIPIAEGYYLFRFAGKEAPDEGLDLQF